MTVDPRVRASWGEDAGAYEQTRPDWPAAALDWLVAQLGLGPGSTVVDLAAGTGKLTRALVGRVGRVIAVEPMPGMRAQLARAVPAAELVDGRADTMPLPSRCADAVVVGEAFHWFATPATMAELHRVLRPGGGVGLLWNLERWEDQPWHRALWEVLPVTPGQHPAPRATWRVLADDPGFDAPVTVRVPHEHRLAPGALADLVSTWSRVATRPPPERAALHERVRALVPGPVALPYETLAVAAQLTPRPATV